MKSLFAQLNLSLMLLTSSAFAASSPEQVVQDFYQALAQGDCTTALQIRPSYKYERCRSISAAQLTNASTLQMTDNKAVVRASGQLTLKGQNTPFEGLIALDHNTNFWQITAFEDAQKINPHDFIAQHMSPVSDPHVTVMNTTAMGADSVDLNNPSPTLERLMQAFPTPNDLVLLVDISEQKMALFQRQQLIREYRISAATKGAGNQAGSDQTPLGVHRIAEKFGDGAPLGTIFKARRNTGTKADIITQPIDVPTDHVTTRILWLDGLEPGKNKGGNVDSKNRFIYIHGTPEEGLIGRPASHGCIRMYNAEVIELYNLLPTGTLVYIGV